MEDTIEHLLIEEFDFSSVIRQRRRRFLRNLERVANKLKTIEIVSQTNSSITLKFESLDSKEYFIQGLKHLLKREGVISE